MKFPFFLILAALVGQVPARQAAVETGSLEISTRVTPTGGRPQPARGLLLYLLRKSLSDIRQEAEEAEPQADFEKFLEGLDVSKELKAWMKRNATAQLNGPEFIRRVTPNDILVVPEFFTAYVTRNANEIALLVPQPKKRDRTPQKTEQQEKQFRQAVRKMAEGNPLTIEGIDLYLAPIDPGQRWARQAGQRQERVRLRALELAESRHLAARAETDLEGRTSILRIPAGEYWLTTLEGEAAAGDVRLRWDAPVRVRGGETTRIELSNLNAVPRERANR